MTKNRQRQLKQSRLAAKRARKGKDREVRRGMEFDPGALTTAGVPFLDDHERMCSAIEDARLLSKFGSKKRYDQWEVEAVIEELLAEGAFPKRPDC